MKLTPINAKVILKLLPAESAGGLIVLPENQRTFRSQRGVVAAVGQGREYPNGTRIPPGVEPGDVVLFNLHAEERDLGGRLSSLFPGLAAVSQEEILGVLDGVVPCPHHHDHALCATLPKGCADAQAAYCDGSGLIDADRVVPEMHAHYRRMASQVDHGAVADYQHSVLDEEDTRMVRLWPASGSARIPAVSAAGTTRAVATPRCSTTRRT